LKTLLTRHGMKQPSDLADVLKIDRRHAWLLWWGEQGLSRTMALRLFEATKIPLEQLLRATDKPTKDHRTPKGRRPRKHPPEKGSPP
jgi:hypothetical protein